MHPADILARAGILGVAVIAVVTRGASEPMGEAGRTFLETLILCGLGKSNMSESGVKVLQKLDSPRNVKLFVSATCPYCP